MNGSADKTKIIYKGDVMAGSFYLLIGVCALLGAIGVYYLTERLGYYYLSIGLLMLSIYMIGKGSVMIYLYRSRYTFYKDHQVLQTAEIKEERRYTRWRVLKRIPQTSSQNDIAFTSSKYLDHYVFSHRHRKYKYRHRRARWNIMEA